MSNYFHTLSSLCEDLVALGVCQGDGLFVHASMKAIGSVIGGPRTVIQSLLNTVGKDGLIGMPGFSTDATFFPEIDRSTLTDEEIIRIEKAVPGFDLNKSPTFGMGVISEAFRNWPGTQRSNHPVDSVCLNGLIENDILMDHSLSWSTGEQTPLGRLRSRPQMKILLIGVGWNRCTAFHTAETLADHKRTKIQRFKTGGSDGQWINATDVANDKSRLFPAVGEALEHTGVVSIGSFGGATCKICDFGVLVDFARDWINNANLCSGDLH